MSYLGRLPLEVHHELFVFMLKILEQANLLDGNSLGIDASGMEANAAMKSIVRRDTGEEYQKMLLRLADESGIRTPTRAEWIAFDHRRKGKSTSNKDWQSSTDEEARKARLEDGRTHMAYKPEHVVESCIRGHCFGCGASCGSGRYHNTCHHP